MVETKKKYDLENRTLVFSKNIREFVRLLPKTVSNREDVAQIVRSSGSIGANYIEANESLGKKDFVMRIKIAKKETRETIYWLELLNCNNDEKLATKREFLIQEATELMKILGSIATKSA